MDVPLHQLEVEPRLVAAVTNTRVTDTNNKATDLSCSILIVSASLVSVSKLAKCASVSTQSSILFNMPG